LKILTVVGARPQFVKAAMVSRAILEANNGSDNTGIVEEIIHTGQHYDDNMSRIFFEGMNIPAPVANLKIGSGTHGEMTGRMLLGLERQIAQRRPEIVLLYGDTDSTLAGALAAAKLNIPVVHVEAGLRSFRKDMAEEINRVCTDHISSILFCPTRKAVANLKNEGITRKVHLVGDVMYDAALAFSSLADKESRILDELSLSAQEYYLATLHRAENTDNKKRLAAILNGLVELAQDFPVVLPLHPRTAKAAGLLHGKCDLKQLRIVSPVSFLDMIRLERNARVIITDSGGVQKEAYFHRVPCVTVRDETEWTETVDAGWNTLVGANARKLVSAVKQAGAGTTIRAYGDGKAAHRIVHIISGFTSG
jgi:UDP-GlcNAc3NAcA epimerase